MLKQKPAFNVVARQRQTSELWLKDREAFASKRDKDTPFDGDFQPPQLDSLGNLQPLSLWGESLTRILPRRTAAVSMITSFYKVFDIAQISSLLGAAGIGVV
jgi:hypothetical protein